MIPNEPYICPRCAIPLTQNKMPLGIFWSCAKCAGRAVTVELLRHTFTPASINPLWLHAIHHEGQSSIACPSCRRPMIQVATAAEADVNVDVCALCHFVWFDAHEVESLVPRDASDIARERRERLAAEKMAHFNAQVDHFQPNKNPSSAIWSTIADILSLRVGGW